MFALHPLYLCLEALSGVVSTWLQWLSVQNVLGPQYRDYCASSRNWILPYHACFALWCCADNIPDYIQEQICSARLDLGEGDMDYEKTMLVKLTLAKEMFDLEGASTLKVRFLKSKQSRIVD